MNISVYVVASVAAVGAAQVAKGIVLLEDFDYAVGALEGANGGTGWSGAWSTTFPNGVTGSMEVSSGSIAFSDYRTAGNKLSMSVTATNAFLTMSANRSIAESATEGDLWQSFLYQRTDGLTSTASRTAEVRFYDGAINFGSQIKPANSTGAAVRYDASTGGNVTSSSNNLHDDSDPYLVITKYAALGTTGAAATMWVLGVSGYDAIKAGGLSESELDAAAIVRATDTTTTVEGLAVGEQLTIINATSAAPFSFAIDELRVGDSLEAVVPEPTGTLAALATFGLLRRPLVRRSRSRD